MDISKLKNTFHGRVITPEDADYDKARTVFYGGVDKRPALIVRVADAEDVKHAVQLAKDEKLELAIRSGGHSVAGYSTCEGGIVIDLRDLNQLDVDTEEQTAWAGSGLAAGEVTKELDKHGLVLGFGDTGSVGIGGITLGGGVGFLVRKFGLAIDNLLAAEIVTAEGKILEVDAENHPDLFWAIRGGGGNFGVATKFKYKLHRLGNCYGGMLLLPATPETISGFVELASKAPKELSAIANIMPAMPMPMIPAEYHGKLAIMALMVYAGHPDAGERTLAPFKALAKPYADMIKPMRYKDIFFPEDESYHPTAVSKNMHLDHVDAEVATTAIEWLDKIDAPVKALQLRVLGGAMAKVPADATAYAHRKQRIMAHIAAFYRSEDETAEKQQWVHDFAKALNQGDDAAYVGFLTPADKDGLQDAYPAPTLKRLKEIKKKYDPKNIFRLNCNIS